MVEVKTFETRADAVAFLDSLGGYRNPDAVTPLKGAAAHEVAVGPVHAGVIEPGHFRFQCMGENVYNLQIFLGYQQRGVEEAIVAADGNLPRQIALAETCAGDTSVAAAICFAEIMEAFNSLPPHQAPGIRHCGEAAQHQAPGTKHQALSTAAQPLRTLLLELERIANHVGDLGALAGDVAFLPTASFCGRIRGEYLNMTTLLCGNRFGRHAVVPGGMRIALTDEKATQLKAWIARVKKDLDGALKLMFEEPTVCDRFDGTGIVPKAVAEELGLVGVARRASVELNGDVLSRARIRRLEIEEAHQKIEEVLGAWCTVTGEGKEARSPIEEPKSREVEESETISLAIEKSKNRKIEKSQIITATINAWRGPLTHAALFEDGRLTAYRIVDPSAFNWQGLAWALRGEQISNFPICNKSFNLSYCGTDK